MYRVKDIKKILDENVQGQEKAKRAAAVLVYNKMRGIKENIVFVGPSGCGKTEIFRALKEKFKNLIFIYDVSNITNDGFSGIKKSYSVFESMIISGFSKEEIENSIIVLDEFDKMCQSKHTAQGDNVSSSIQAEFLTMIEGTVVKAKVLDDYVYFNTSNISFVFCGAFEDIYKKKKMSAQKSFGFSNETNKTDETITTEDLIDYGVRTEIMGRISRIVELYYLSEEDIKNLLMDPHKSPISKLAIDYKCEIDIKEDTIDMLIKSGLDNSRGVRALRGIIQDYIDMEIYEPGSSKSLTIRYQESEQSR